MRLQSASENNIIIGRGEIMGVVEPSSGRKGWALPGGRYTFDKAVAEKAAGFIDRVISRP